MIYGGFRDSFIRKYPQKYPQTVLLALKGLREIAAAMCEISSNPSDENGLLFDFTVVNDPKFLSYITSSFIALEDSDSQIADVTFAAYFLTTRPHDFDRFAPIYRNRPSLECCPV